VTRKTALLIAIPATLLLAAVIAIVAFIAPRTDPGFKDAGLALTFITGSAVVIERLIEAFWTIIGGALGAYWPLSEVGGQVSVLTQELNKSLVPFQEQASARIEELKKAGNLAKEQIDRLNEASADIDRLKGRIAELQKLAPDNQRMRLLAAEAAQNVAYLRDKYGDILKEFNGAADVANLAIGGIQNFLASFKDNPGRTLISLYLGAILGLGVSGGFGLDVFQAVLGSTQHPVLGVILTGLLIGLGSSPTHEVIRAIQEYKTGRKVETVMQAGAPAATRDSATGRR
jgi:hypothetical protein